MADIIVADCRWKVGEKGDQEFHLFDSDGETVRNGSGKAYKLYFWLVDATTLKNSALLTAIDALKGKWKYALQTSDNDAVAEYDAEIEEEPTGTILTSNTFKITVMSARPAT